MVGRLLSRISALQCAAAAAEATRRQLHNQMVELRGNVRPQGAGRGRCHCCRTVLRFCIANPACTQP